MKPLFHTLAVVVLCWGCAGSSLRAGGECPGERLAEWQIHPSWCVRELSPTEAEREVLSGTLPLDGIRNRWQELRAKWQDGDRYWLYVMPEEEWLNPTSTERGIVLIRGCRQVGHLATSLGSERGVR